VEYFPPEVTAVDANVVVDGKVVTSRGPATSTEFALTLVEQLYGKEKAEEIAKTMVRVLALLLPLMCSCPAARQLAVHF
jgi:4-methyl-5(b-hydroxyethyl)-thiazole monophosphate biosynthesis